MDEENVSVLCRICISSNSNSTQQMIPIFGDDSLWQKITTLADVKIDADDTLPQQVCVACANSAISACVFKKKCEDADRFFRQQLLLQKVENVDGITDEADKVAAPLDGNNEATSSLTKENNNNDNEIVVVNNNNNSKKTNKQTDDHGNEADNDDDDDDGDEESSDDSSDESSGSSDSDDDDDDDSNDSDSNQDKEKKAKALKNAEEHHQHELDHENENEHDNDEHQRQILAAGMSSLMAAGYGIAEDGEIKCPNGIKAPFDFNSIRLMHEYMQQQLSKINGHHMLDNNGQHSDNEHNEAGEGSESAAGANDEDGLPLIPEIELITPSEDNVAAMAAATSVNGGMSASAAEAYDVGSMAQMRGYQCPSCYQIFEMKNILKAHMLSVHGTAGPVYECNNCKKTYFYKRFLEKHVRRGRCVKKRRNQTRPMQCTDCDVLFPTGHHLGWHKRTGCPSRAAKLPLQQLFKQNVAKTNPYVNNRIGLRKPENAIYLHNRKLLMASNKRKGRTRIKLDAKKIALAKQLILREATTTVIANELNISRTFAWRLRKSLVNGVSLHERVIEPSALDDVQLNGNEQNLQDQQEQQQQQQQQHLLQQQYILQQQQRQLQVNDFPHIKMAGHIKPEKTESDDNDHDATNDVERLVKDAILDESAPHGPLPLLVNNEQNASNSHDDDDEDNCPRENGLKENNNLIDSKDALKRAKNSMTGAGAGGINLYSLHHSQEQFLKNMVAHAQRENVIVANGGGVDFHKHAKNGGGLPTLPLLNFPPAVAAAINHLPVNLSIRPIASMQKMETSNYKKLNNMIPSTLSSPDTTQMSSMSGGVKKPRKPNVFIDDEKYAMAKILVAQNASTMEIARALNVSQMTAWKVRDAIVKGLPLSYRNKREREMQAHNATAMLYNRHEDVGSSGGSDGGGSSDNKLLLQQQQQQQVVQHMQHEHDELQRQKQQQQMQQQHMKLVQRQQQQQRLLYQEQQQQQLLLQQEQQKQQLKLQEQQKHLNNNNNNSNNNNDNNNKPLAATTTTIPTTTKLGDQQPPEHMAIGNGGQKRRRLKAAEREMRDKEITREILELIKEDSNIQYWKVSARLAEKGYPISPSSVCQKLKSMGIHRRWKFADKPKPLPMDIEHLKVAAVAAANSAAINDPLAGNTNGVGVLSDAAVAAAAAAAASNFESAQFHMGGAHFLSAFTR